MPINIGNGGNEAEGTTRFKFAWKPFFIYGIIWLLIFSSASLVVGAGKQYVDQQRRFQQMIEEFGGQFGGDRDRPFDPWGEGQTLEDWISQNLPPRCNDERIAVADVFDNVAELIVKGDLRGQSDSFAEIISELQAVATRKTWLPFLTKLTNRVKSENLDSPDDIADVFKRIAKSLRGNDRKRRSRAVEQLSDVADEPIDLEQSKEEPKDVESVRNEEAKETPLEVAEPVKDVDEQKDEAPLPAPPEDKTKTEIVAPAPTKATSYSGSNSSGSCANGNCSGNAYYPQYQGGAW